LESKNFYETPLIEVVEFKPEDSIATSAGPQGAGLWEQMWGESS